MSKQELLLLVPEQVAQPEQKQLVQQQASAFAATEAVPWAASSPFGPSAPSAPHAPSAPSAPSAPHAPSASVRFASDASSAAAASMNWRKDCSRRAAEAFASASAWVAAAFEPTAAAGLVASEHWRERPLVPLLLRQCCRGKTLMDRLCLRDSP